jgi:hypothetical protein
MRIRDLAEAAISGLEGLQGLPQTSVDLLAGPAVAAEADFVPRSTKQAEPVVPVLRLSSGFNSSITGELNHARSIIYGISC